MTARSRDRYSRRILFSGIGEQRQQKLLDARVAIAGCGALGTFHAAALARAGAGFLRIIDGSAVLRGRRLRRLRQCWAESGWVYV